MTNNMGEVKVSKSPSPKVEELINIIRHELDAGRKRLAIAVDQETKRTYWTVGKHIKVHLMENEDRAEYGKELIPLLAQNLSVSSQVLYRCVQFYEMYPKILSAPRELTWTHLNSLFSIKDVNLRADYAQRVVDEDLTTRELEELIIEDRGPEEGIDKSKQNTLKTKREAPYMYKYEQIDGGIRVDLGFHIYRDNPKQEFGKAEVTHYTYSAKVLEIIDGDTIWLEIDLGFGVSTKQKVRLRGIDAQSLDSVIGGKALKFIEKELANCDFVAARTYWRDKFDRYLVDIFYLENESDLNKVIKKGKFLNQELLNEGLAKLI